MIKFLKAQASSLIATGVDWTTVFVLSALAGAWSAGINVVGAIAGGIANFIINRQWVFSKEKGAFGGQALRYVLTWTGNMLLNTACMWTIMHFTKWHDDLEIVGTVKMVISLLIGFTYSYIMQKRFVFK